MADSWFETGPIPLLVSLLYHVPRHINFILYLQIVTNQAILRNLRIVAKMNKFPKNSMTLLQIATRSQPSHRTHASTGCDRLPEAPSYRCGGHLWPLFLNISTFASPFSKLAKQNKPNLPRMAVYATQRHVQNKSLFISRIEYYNGYPCKPLAPLHLVLLNCHNCFKQSWMCPLQTKSL